MKKALTSIICTILLIFGITVLCVSFNGGVQANAAGSKTGVGLAEHALKAYNNGWKYSYGAYGQISGGTRISDCAGLIKSYLWWTNDSSNPNPGLCTSVGGGANSMRKSASKSGTINYSNSSSLPRVHGLILFESCGHVGVYIGNNIAIDNRGTGYDMKKEAVFSRRKWDMWFKLPQISYPTTGWVTYNGQSYYYEDGQYVVSTTKTIDGKTYTFGASGVVNGSAPETVSERSYATAATNTAAKAAEDKAAASKAAVEKAAAEKAAAEKAAADKAAADKAKADSEAAAASAQVALESAKAALASSAISSKSVVSFNDEVIPKAAAPALAESAQQPTNSNNGTAIVIAILAIILSGSVVLERKLNKVIKTKRYVPANDMMFNRISHFVENLKHKK